MPCGAPTNHAVKPRAGRSMVMTVQPPREPPKKRIFPVTAKPMMHSAKRFKPKERVEDAMDA